MTGTIASNWRVNLPTSKFPIHTEKLLSRDCSLHLSHYPLREWQWVALLMAWRPTLSPAPEFELPFSVKQIIMASPLTQCFVQYLCLVHACTIFLLTAQISSPPSSPPPLPLHPPLLFNPFPLPLLLFVLEMHEHSLCYLIGQYFICYEGLPFTPRPLPLALRWASELWTHILFALIP